MRPLDTEYLIATTFRLTYFDRRQLERVLEQIRLLPEVNR